MALFSATKFGFLVLVWSTSYVVASLTVDEQLEQLTNSYRKLAQILASKDSRLEYLEQKIQQHESILNDVQRTSRSYNNVTVRQVTTEMPKSCADLRRNGHMSSGIFLIVGVKMVETVYCDFSKSENDPSFQKWIGFADVKSSPVYFHAQRVGNYEAANTVIPFNQFRLNVANALNPVTGVFLAPKTGTYFFGFSGLSYDSNAKVQLQMKNASTDWFKIGEAHCTSYNTFALQTILPLKKGDEIRIIHIHGVIHDTDGNNFSNFVGLLLEEEIVEW